MAKQTRLYELIPIDESLAEEARVKQVDRCEESFIVEALDDVVLERVADASFLNKEENIVKARKFSRKLTVQAPVDDKKIFDCLQCEVVVSSKISLKRHVDRVSKIASYSIEGIFIILQVHNKLRNFHCDLCCYSGINH